MNAREPVAKTLKDAFPAYTMWADELKRLFTGYVDAKQRRHVLDYDDLLLYWFYLMSDQPSAVSRQRSEPLRLCAGGRIPRHQCDPGGDSAG